MFRGRRRGLALAAVAALSFAVAGDAVHAARSAQDPWRGTWVLSMRAEEGPDAKDATLWIRTVGGRLYAVTPMNGLFKTKVNGVLKDTSGNLDFQAPLTGRSHMTMKGSFDLKGYAKGVGYRGKGDIVGSLKVLPSGPTVFSARLLTPNGRLVATIVATKRSDKLVGKAKFITDWSKTTVAPGSSVKLTITIESKLPYDLPAGAVKVLFSVPTGALTKVTGLRLRGCGEPVKQGVQTTVTCVPLALGVAGLKAEAILWLHVPADFPGKRLGVGMKLLDADTKDAYVVTGHRTALITLLGSSSGADGILGYWEAGGGVMHVTQTGPTTFVGRLVKTYTFCQSGSVPLGQDEWKLRRTTPNKYVGTVRFYRVSNCTYVGDAKNATWEYRPATDTLYSCAYSPDPSLPGGGCTDSKRVKG